VGVYHLSPNEAAPAEVADSTGIYPGTWEGSPAEAVPGMIGDAARFDGSRFIEVGDEDEFSVDPNEARTLEVWFSADDPEQQSIVYQEGQCRGWRLTMTGGGDLEGHLSAALDTDVCGVYNEYTVTETPAIRAWQYAALVVDRPGETMRLFLDGTLAATGGMAGIGDADADGNGPFHIGADWDGLDWFTGSIDEVRVSSSARSAGWIAAQHRSMRDDLLIFEASQR
jgi:hypothetical protein